MKGRNVEQFKEANLENVCKHCSENVCLSVSYFDIFPPSLELQS